MPLPLRLILAATVILNVAWAVLMPPFNGPDEDSHFVYVQRLVEDGDIPWSVVNDQPENRVGGSPEVGAALVYGGILLLRANPAARPFGNAVDERLWRAVERRLGPDARNNPRGFTSTFRNPPLYYAYATLPYLAGTGSDVFTRAYLVRLWNLPLALAVVALTWLVAGELLGALWWPRAVAATFVAAQPALLNVSGVVNPDVLLAAAASAEIYAIVLVFKRGPTRWRLAGVVAAALAATLTHPRGSALLVPAALCLFFVLARWRSWRTPVVAAALGGGAALGAIATISRIGTDASRLREFASYLWQFYLPRLPFMQPKLGPPFGFRQVFVERMYGAYAQLEVGFDAAVYDALHVAALVLIAAVLAVLVVNRRTVARHWHLGLTLLVLAVSLLLAVHVVGFESLRDGPGDPIVTSRYVLPLLTLIGTGIGAVCLALRRVGGVVLAGLLVWVFVLLGVGSLGLVLTRFYA